MQVRETLIAYRQTAARLAAQRQRSPSVVCDRCEVVHRRATSAFPAVSDYVSHPSWTCDVCEVELATYEFVKAPKPALERLGIKPDRAA